MQGLKAKIFDYDLILELWVFW